MIPVVGDGKQDSIHHSTRTVIDLLVGLRFFDTSVEFQFSRKSKFSYLLALEKFSRTHRQKSHKITSFVSYFVDRQALMGSTWYLLLNVSHTVFLAVLVVHLPM